MRPAWFAWTMGGLESMRCTCWCLGSFFVSACEGLFWVWVLVWFSAGMSTAEDEKEVWRVGPRPAVLLFPFLLIRPGFQTFLYMHGGVQAMGLATGVGERE